VQGLWGGGEGGGGGAGKGAQRTHARTHTRTRVGHNAKALITYWLVAGSSNNRSSGSGPGPGPSCFCFLLLGSTYHIVARRGTACRALGTCVLVLVVLCTRMCMHMHGVYVRGRGPFCCCCGFWVLTSDQYHTATKLRAL
jgi:hypothetical protein